MDECDGKISLKRSSLGGSRDTQMDNSHYMNRDYQFRSMSALEILRETVRILRYTCAGFMIIAALLICPVSSVQLSNVLVDHDIVRRLTVRLLLIARTSGLPLSPVVKQSCQKFSEMVISTSMCFPLYVTLSLLSKAEVVYSVDCTYSKKQFECLDLYVDCWGCVFVGFDGSSPTVGAKMFRSKHSKSKLCKECDSIDYLRVCT